MKNIIKIFLITFIFLNYTPGHSWDVYDRVIATVNETPIIESEVLLKFERLKTQKKIHPKMILNEKSRLLDKFIEEAIVEQTARNESIIVSQEKIDNQIKKVMERMEIKSIDHFKKEIEKSEKIPFEEYREEMKKSIMTEQIMSIAIGITPPSIKEAEDWYKKNKGKMGFELNMQHIMIKLQNDSFTENKRINTIANEIVAKLRSGQSFERLAKEFSEDPATKNSGGNMGWIALSNLAKNDYILADNVYKEFIIGKRKLSIVKSNTGYHVIKYNGRRQTSFEAVKDDIFNLLYQKNMAEQFKKWVLQKRSQSDIKIYMQEYIKEKVSS
ncbi:MAG: peptidylprolyl isomerase [Spirochaetes bacterium]|nr:peptidylprolyl isomerase [Spirochaetota bacterium]